MQTGCCVRLLLVILFPIIAYELWRTAYTQHTHTMSKRTRKQTRTLRKQVGLARAAEDANLLQLGLFLFLGCFYAF